MKSVHKSMVQESKPWNSFKVLTELVVRWRDLDSYNHVNNSVYLNFFEEGRVAYYLAMKISFESHGSALQNDSFNTTLIRTSVEFKGQAFLHDSLVIGTRMTMVRRSFVDSEYGIFKKDTGQLLATGSATQLCIDPATFKPRTIPPEILQAMERIEEKKLTGKKV